MDAGLIVRVLSSIGPRHEPIGSGHDGWRMRRSHGRVAVSLLVAVAACSPVLPTDPGSSSPTPRGSPSGLATPGAATPIPSVTVTPMPSASPTGPTGWQESPDQAAFHGTDLGTGMTSVIWTGSRFLATNILAEPLLFDSVDGRTWHRQPPFETTAWTSGPRLVAAGPEGVVAVGGGNGGPLAFWHSADGLTWSAAPEQPAFRSHDGSFEAINAVTAADAGWVAVGGESYNSTGPALLRAVVLVSTDGLHWTRQPDSPALEHASMNAIARTASGYVAVGAVIGTAASGGTELEPAVWTSPDGATWSKATGPPGYARPPAPERTAFELRDVAVRGDRMVSVGWVASDDTDQEPFPTLAVSWWSDGGAWTPVEVDLVDGGRWLTVDGAPGGFVALAEPGTGCGGGIWGSQDGEAWTCEGNDPVFADAWVMGVAASGDIELLVGYRNIPSGSSTATAWTLALR
jgi:hypothetical protein